MRSRNNFYDTCTGVTLMSGIMVGDTQDANTIVVPTHQAGYFEYFFRPRKRFCRMEVVSKIVIYMK